MAASLRSDTTCGGIEYWRQTGRTQACGPHLRNAPNSSHWPWCRPPGGALLRVHAQLLVLCVDAPRN